METNIEVTEMVETAGKDLKQTLLVYSRFKKKHNEKRNGTIKKKKKKDSRAEKYPI